ncbi:MerR family DNA-binding transcriptional regulator [Luxibacter massiliensis]|uniref:MerR family DNA-binding transcriptional regulator n=1 Tax=Luxibacter massiliensis TaxID=2219695 RepID=UPI000F045274|nr:MerR family DNA-binding transcriptional regulator [Luxibacter massiliensis]
MERLTVGEMAKLNHISEQTLRLYDKIGLFSPSMRGENGYRYYDIKQSALLDIIQYMKSLGISLKEIKYQLEQKDLSCVEAALKEKYRQTEEDIRALKCQRRALERTIESFSRYRSAPPDGTLQMEYIGQRQMYVIDTGMNFYEHDTEYYENALRRLQDRFLMDNLPQIYFCNAGTILRQQDFLVPRFYATEVFVFVDREFVKEELITTIPAGNYACIYCDDFYKEKEYISRLLKYIKNAGCEVCGDYLCESIADIPVTRGDSRGLYLRLQVPVRFR